MTTLSQKIKDAEMLMAQHEKALQNTTQSALYEKLRRESGSTATQREAAFQAMRKTNEYIQFCYAQKLYRNLCTQWYQQWD